MTTIVEKQSLVYTPAPMPLKWSAVVGGLILTYAASWLLYNLGSAIGLSIVDISSFTEPGSSDDVHTFDMMVIIWVFFTTLISFFLGSLFAGRLSGIPDKAIGMLHGVAVWASATLISVMFGILGVNGIVKATVDGLEKSNAMQGTSIGLLNSDPEGRFIVPSYLQPLIYKLNREINSSESYNPDNSDSDGKPRMISDGILALVAIRVIQGDTEDAKNLLIDMTSLSPTQANRIIDNLSAKAEGIRASIKKKSETAQEYLSALLWMLFTSSTGALLASVLGGWIGVISVARIYSMTLY